MQWLRANAARREFESFVADSTGPLLRTAFLMARDLAEAEDLVQETFRRVARHWPRVCAMNHPAAYARRVLVNLVIDGAERRSRRTGELAGWRNEFAPGQRVSPEAGNRNASAFDQITAMLWLYTMPSKLTAELYYALADVPGVTVDGHATDLAGRPGVAFVLPPENGYPYRLELVLNRSDYRLTGPAAVVLRARGGKDRDPHRPARAIRAAADGVRRPLGGLPQRVVVVGALGVVGPSGGPF